MPPPASPRPSSPRSSTIVEGFRRRLGAAVQVDVEFVPQIAPEKSGKFRYVVSHALEAA